MSARIFGRGLRRGAAAALVSALVAAAMTASQGPGGGRSADRAQADGGQAQPVADAGAAPGGDSAYFTELPP
ncbi:hypothetical protein [Streptomyces sp. RerS4]|uniref:hypothetical protein n=1 Tax=Streptomyces sp. RerS4 TaxID=2942449 RepID=UPI00201BE229|nr:hypothetical protein [Streptomyces sp. RerS4]UQX00659.1 hypothetical protein M4D82_09050 [Streptomyces sp. RerS4]